MIEAHTGRTDRYICTSTRRRLAAAALVPPAAILGLTGCTGKSMKEELKTAYYGYGVDGSSCLVDTVYDPFADPEISRQPVATGSFDASANTAVITPHFVPGSTAPDSVQSLVITGFDGDTKTKLTAGNASTEKVLQFYGC